MASTSVEAFFDKKFDKPYFAHVPAAVAGTDFVHSIAHSPEETRMLFRQPMALVRPDMLEGLVMDLTITVDSQYVTFDCEDLLRCAFRKIDFVKAFEVQGGPVLDGVLRIQITDEYIGVSEGWEYSESECAALLCGPLGSFLVSHYKCLIQAYRAMPNEDQIAAIAAVAVNESLLFYHKEGQDIRDCRLPTREQLSRLRFSVACSDHQFGENTRYSIVGDIKIRVVDQGGDLVAIVAQLPSGNIFADRFNEDLTRRLSRLPVTFVQDILTSILVHDELTRRQIGHAIERLCRVSIIMASKVMDLADQEEASNLPSASSFADEQFKTPPARGGEVFRYLTDHWPSDGSSDDN